MWMGLGWMNGTVNTGQRSSKSTYGANNKYWLPSSRRSGLTNDPWLVMRPPLQQAGQGSEKFFFFQHLQMQSVIFASKDENGRIPFFLLHSPEHSKSLREAALHRIKNKKLFVKESYKKKHNGEIFPEGWRKFKIQQRRSAIQDKSVIFLFSSLSDAALGLASPSTILFICVSTTIL